MTTQSELQEYKNLQELALNVAKETSLSLKPGDSELDATKMMEEKFATLGITRYFHRPFAWFGKRSGFYGFSKALTIDSRGIHTGQEFFPKKEIKLKPAMPFILDAAPATILATVDIGQSYCYGENAEYSKAQELLKNLKIAIPPLFEQKMKICDIYHKVDHFIREAGYENIHSLYPKGVLGHLIGKLPLINLPTPTIQRFSPQAYLFFLKRHPFIDATTTRLPQDGLWAIEPHIRGLDFGVKFEEILYFKDGKASWLSEIPIIS